MPQLSTAAEAHLRRVMGPIQAFLRHQDCTLMPLADRLALEVRHRNGERAVFELVDDDTPILGAVDPDGHIVSGFRDVEEVVGRMGWFDIPGVYPRRTLAA